MTCVHAHQWWSIAAACMGMLGARLGAERSLPVWKVNTRLRSSSLCMVQPSPLLAQSSVRTAWKSGTSLTLTVIWHTDVILRLYPLCRAARAPLYTISLLFSLNLPLSLLPAPFSTTLWTGKHADTSATVPLWTFKIRADAEKNKKYLSSYSTTYNIFVLHCFSSYYIYIKMI